MTLQKALAKEMKASGDAKKQIEQLTIENERLKRDETKRKEEEQKKKQEIVGKKIFDRILRP